MSPEQLLDDDGDDNSSATSTAASATTVSASDPLVEAGSDDDLLEATTVWVGNFSELWVSHSVFVRIITKVLCIYVLVLSLGKC